MFGCEGKKKNPSSSFPVVSSKSCTALYWSAIICSLIYMAEEKKKEENLNDSVEVGGERKIQALFSASECKNSLSFGGNWTNSYRNVPFASWFSFISDLVPVTAILKTSAWWNNQMRYLARWLICTLYIFLTNSINCSSRFIFSLSAQWLLQPAKTFRFFPLLRDCRALSPSSIHVGRPSKEGKGYVALQFLEGCQLRLSKRCRAEEQGGGQRRIWDLRIKTIKGDKLVFSFLQERHDQNRSMFTIFAFDPVENWEIMRHSNICDTRGYPSVRQVLRNSRWIKSQTTVLTGSVTREQH